MKTHLLARQAVLTICLNLMLFPILFSTSDITIWNSLPEKLTCDNATDGGEISGNEAGCPNPVFDPSLIVNVVLPSGGSGDLEYIWIYTTIDPLLPVSYWIPIPGTNSSEYDPGPITQTTWFRRCARRAGCDDYVAESNYIVKEISCCVNFEDGGEIGYDQESCLSVFDPSLLVNITSPSGGNGNAVYTWYNSTTGPPFSPATWQIIPGAGLLEYDPPSINSTTWYIRFARRAECADAIPSNIVQVQIFPGITLSGNVSPSTCYGSNNGAINLTISGGSPGFTVLWSNGANTEDINGLSAGNYSVTVLDSKGCSNTATFLVPEPNDITISLTGSNPTCPNAQNGSISLIVQGGSPPYSFNWDNAPDVQNPTNLGPGLYSVTVTDANNCTASGSITIVEPPALNLTLTKTDITCFGAKNGTATAIVSGGTAPYTYLWNTLPVQTTAIAVNLSAGTYTVTITDANNCTSTASIPIATPPSINLTVTKTDVNCFGGSNGTATASVIGGTSPYNYVWNTVPVQTTATAVNLGAGTYTVTVTDANNCSASASITISTPPSLNLTVNKTDITCFGQSNGTATAIVSGGALPYTYVWNTVPSQTTSTVLNLGIGTYTVTVTDANNCTVSASITIAAPLALNLTVTKTDVTCFGSTNGTATASVSGGNAPYTYLWNTVPVQITSTAVNLSPGTYTVIVTDANNCTASGSITIVTPPALSLTVTKTDVTCFGSTNGTATASVSGGTAPFSFVWNTVPVQTTATVVNLGAGTYSITVTDANNCTATAVISIISHPLLILTFSKVDESCIQEEDGMAEVSATGGVGPYSYKWNDPSGSITGKVNNLAPGTYTVTVTDNVGCTMIGSVVILQSLKPCDCNIRKGDFVWYDFDEDGLQDANELGINGVPVHLVQAGPDGQYGSEDDIKIMSTVTSGSGFNTGYYYFENVCQGTYAICFEIDTTQYLFSPYHQGNNHAIDSDADPVTGCTAPFTITANSTDDLTWDAGVQDYCINVEYPGEIGYDETICYGEIPSLIVNVVSPTGGSGDLEYLWLRSEVTPIYYPGNNYWEEIPNSNSPEFQPGVLEKTTYYLRCVRRVGCDDFLESNIVTITVIKPDATILNGYFNPLCVDKGYIFQAKGNGIGATYFWTFGPDGTPSVATGQTVFPVKWPTVGPKTVTLTVNIGECTATESIEYVADICACKPAFLDFDAVAVKDSVVIISWTADTWEVDHVFLVERSLDGIDYNYVTTVSGKINEVKSYAVIDKKPYKGESFYRVRLVDMLTNKDMTQAKRVFLLDFDSLPFDFYPNPVSNNLTIRLHEASGKSSEMHFFDVVGKLLHVEKLTEGSRSVEIDCSDWIDGTIIVYVYLDGKRPIPFKFAKIR